MFGGAMKKIKLNHIFGQGISVSQTLDGFCPSLKITILKTG